MAVDNTASYYDAGGIETIEVVKAKLTPEQFIGYLLGTSMVYDMRANFKEDFHRDQHKSLIFKIMLRNFLDGNPIGLNCNHYSLEPSKATIDAVVGRTRVRKNNARRNRTRKKTNR